MNIYRLQEDLTLYFSTYKNGYNNTGAARWLATNNPQLWNNVVKATTFLPENAPPKQRCWHILNNVITPVLTIDTNEPARWFGSKYFMFSKVGAANSNPESNKKRKETWIKKYGVDNPAKSEPIKSKMKSTNAARYGHENYFKSEESKRQTRESWADPIKKSNRINNIQNAWHAKYGCHISQVPEIQKRQQKFRTKKYTLPSGRQVNIQGYEDRALNELLKIYDEADLKIGSFETPRIYYEYEGQIKIYFPDIFIVSENKLIEVKSPWTFKIDQEKNLAKEKAAREQGFLFEFKIYNK